MPSRNILVINCGSSSIKFALVNEAHSLFPLHGLAERLGSRDAVLRWKRGGDSDPPGTRRETANPRNGTVPRRNPGYVCLFKLPCAP